MSFFASLSSDVASWGRLSGRISGVLVISGTERRAEIVLVMVLLMLVVGWGPETYLRASCAHEEVRLRNDKYN